MARLENIVKRYNDYISNMLPSWGGCDEPKTGEIFDIIIGYMLNRTQRIFKWSGLPDTIPQRILEMYLQINGNCAFYKYNGELYVYTGGLGGNPDVYYRPTIYTIANPAQGLSINAKIDVDCIVMPNDSLYMGLMPLNARYARNMAETEISMHVSNINSRIISLISAQDDRTLKSAEKYLDDVKQGKLGIIAEQKFFEDLKATVFAGSGSSQNITNLIELMQYNKASWFNEVGLNANYNMKRESINTGESQLNNDALTPLIDDMLECRKEYAEKVNNMFGTNISVDFSSAWKDNEIELEIEHENMEGGTNENDVDIVNETSITGES